MDTRLMRSRSDRMMGGVAGGIARYFNIDPVIVRLVFVLSIFAGGVSPLVYLVLWIVMPEDLATQTVATPVQMATPVAQPKPIGAVMLPDHPRGPEQWKFDPYTGEKISQ
ncbi:MAG: PspC domain-containing protein [Roseiflexaceae bacterium]|nr:PspC domain-containing protein [Roseiflexaceae bacterium]